MLVCSVKYPARNAHAPYCLLWPAPSLQYFPTLSQKRHDFRKQVTEYKMRVLIFCTKFCSTFVILRRIERDMVKKSVSVFMQSTGYFCQILMKFEFSRPFFEKLLKIKFHDNPSSGNRVAPCGRTDMTKLIVAFCNFARAPEKQ